MFIWAPHFSGWVERRPNFGDLAKQGKEKRRLLSPCRRALMLRKILILLEPKYLLLFRAETRQCQKR